VISRYFSRDKNYRALNEIIRQQVKEKSKKELSDVVPNCTAGHNILLCLDARCINKFQKLLDGFREEKPVKGSWTR